MGLSGGVERHDPRPTRRRAGALCHHGHQSRRRAARLPLARSGPAAPEAAGAGAAGAGGPGAAACAGRAPRLRLRQRSAADPRVASRGGDLSGVRGSLRPGSWSAVPRSRRLGGDLRGHAAGADRPARLPAAAGHHLPVADADLPQPLAPRLRPDRSGRDRASPRLDGRLAGVGGRLPRPRPAPAARLRGQPRVERASAVPGRPGRCRRSGQCLVPLPRSPPRLRLLFRCARPARAADRSPGGAGLLPGPCQLLAGPRLRWLPARLRRQCEPCLLVAVPGGHPPAPPRGGDLGRDHPAAGGDALLCGPPRRLPRFPAAGAAAGLLRLPQPHGQRLRARAGPAPGLLRCRSGAAQLPRQPRHEPIPVVGGGGQAAAAAGGPGPVQPAGATDCVLRHRGGPEPAGGGGAAGGIAPADALGWGAGPGVAGFLPGVDRLSPRPPGAAAATAPALAAG